MITVKVVKVGNALGFVLPKTACATMNVAAGDDLYLVSTSDGHKLTPYDPAFAEQMGVLREVMRRRSHVLADLAKGSTP